MPASADSKSAFRNTAHQLGVGGEHGAQGDGDLAEGECGGPPPVVAVIQDVQADVAVAVYVRVHRRGRDEVHLRAA